MMLIISKDLNLKKISDQKLKFDNIINIINRKNYNYDKNFG